MGSIDDGCRTLPDGATGLEALVYLAGLCRLGLAWTGSANDRIHSGGSFALILPSFEKTGVVRRDAGRAC